MIYATISEQGQTLYEGESFEEAVRIYTEENAYQILYEVEEGNPFHVVDQKDIEDAQIIAKVFPVTPDQDMRKRWELEDIFLKRLEKVLVMFNVRKHLNINNTGYSLIEREIVNAFVPKETKQIIVHSFESFIDFVRYLSPHHNLRVVNVGDTVTFEMSESDWKEAKSEYDADSYTG